MPTLTDPTTAGNCDACPLKAYWERKGAWRPVPAELNGTETIVVGEAPSKQDTEAGHPWVDMHGADALDGLTRAGLKRHDVSWTYAVGCRWPNDRSQQFLAGLKKRNRYRKKKGLPPHPTPMACCAPRLQQDLTGHANVITMGDLAAKTILPGAPNFMAVRGGPTVAQGRKVLPTFHPRQLYAWPRFKAIFRKDLTKAVRFFDDNLNWSDPEVLWNPSLETLQALYRQWRERRALVAYDYETDSIESLTARVRCIGVGDQDTVVMYHFLSRDGETRFYSDDIGPWSGSLEEEEEVLRTLRDILVDGRITKVGHNAGYYDRLVAEQQWGITPRPLIDTILIHKLAESEYPHGLGYIGSVYTDVPAWKAEHTATEAKTDHELGTYCATDVAVTARIVRPISHLMAKRGQRDLYNHDADLQNMCVGMHRMGMRIDEERRWAHEQTQATEASHWLDVATDIVPEVNLNSPAQLQSLLFDKWALPPQQFTDSGDPSTNAASLIALLGNPTLDDHQREFIGALRKYRKAQKLLSTYLLKLAPESEIVHDGYVYPDYNVGGAVTGRLSSSNPNFQNIPYLLRDIFIPPEGRVFIEADYDQLELRFAAAVAGAGYYLDAFAKKEVDPHNLTGALMFGEGFWDLPGAPEDRFLKGAGVFKKARDAAKTLCFLSLYGGGASMAHEKMVSTEDLGGNLIYSHYSQAEVRALHRRWLRNVPEFKAWWESCIQHWRTHGYVVEKILGRRRYFHEEDYNAIVNYEVQAGGFALVALGMRKLVRKIPWNFSKKIGLCNQLHDAVLVSVDEDRAEQAKKEVIECLTTEALGMEFTVEARIARHWGGK